MNNNNIDLSVLESISAKIENMKNKYNSEKVILSTHEKQKEDILKKIDDISSKKDEVGMKMSILQEASTEARNNARDLLEDVSTNAVQMIMGDNLSVNIDLNTKGQSATAEVVIKVQNKNEVVETDPAEEEGGGLADIVALSTFLSIGQLVGKDNLAPKFLDEPSKYVSKGNSEKVAEFLKEMVDYTERQTFLITHDEYLSNIGDVAYKFALDENGTTKAEKLQ